MTPVRADDIDRLAKRGPRQRSAADLLVDLSEAISLATLPLPLRVGHVAVDGAVTLLVGRPGESKSWLGQFACAGVHLDQPVGPLTARAGVAVYLDAEGGTRLMGRRVLLAGMDERSFLYADGTRLHLPGDIGLVEELVTMTGARLLVLDSLRRLAPGMKESESDSAAPVVAALARVARATGCAVVAIHHRSTKPGAPNVRGSSALEDQADIVWQLEKVAGDPDGRHRRRLRCSKMRVDVEPAPVWLDFKMVAGFMTLAEAEPYESTSDPDRDDGPQAHEQLADSIRALAAQVAGESGWTPGQVADAVGSSQQSGTFKRAIDLLVHRGEWEALGTTRSRRYRPSAIRAIQANSLRDGPNGPNPEGLFDADQNGRPEAPPA